MKKKVIKLKESDLERLVNKILKEEKNQLKESEYLKDMDEEEVEESEKWIQKAIGKKGSLRRKMGTHKGETIPSEKMEKKLSSLKKKDTDPETPGVQGLSKDDLSTYRQIMLAKRLKKFKY